MSCFHSSILSSYCSERRNEGTWGRPEEAGILPKTPSLADQVSYTRISLHLQLIYAFSICSSLLHFAIFLSRSKAIRVYLDCKSKSSPGRKIWSVIVFVLNQLKMEFPDLGRHCSEESCYQLDFLPFECDGCKKVFCLEHRTYKAHSCANENHKDVRVLICTVCKKSVRAVFGESSEVTMKKHSQSSSCDPSSVVRKPKCPVRGCKELLTFSNKYSCDSCRKVVCLRHRFPSEHACGIKTKEPARTAAASNFLTAFVARITGTDCGIESSRMGSLSISDKKIEKEKTPTIRP